MNNMLIPWIEQLKELNINKDNLKADDLSEEQLNVINDQIIKPNKLSSESIQEQLFNDNTVNEGFLVLEASIITNKPEDWSKLHEWLKVSLDISRSNWRWSNNLSSKYEQDYYYKLRILRVLLQYAQNTPYFLDLITLLSYHIHPTLPWTCPLNSELLTITINRSSELQEQINGCMVKYMTEVLKSELLDLPKSKQLSKLTVAGYSRPLKNGLRPRLGFGDINGQVSEEDKRRNWKSSSKVKSFSMVWFVIFMIRQFDWLEQHWSIITSFILNVLDDHDLLIKVQGCKLLRLLLDKLEAIKSNLLTKTGLIDLFIESTKICLSYLPSLTPVDDSILLLSDAYPAMYKLLKMKDKIDFIELINTTLSSISHIKSNRSAYRLLTFLINQVGIITRFLGSNILISMSRVNFILNQVLTDPYVIEKDVKPIESCLAVQYTILSLFNKLNDIDAIGLIFEYRYDLLAAWTIAFRRSSNDNIIKSIKQNFSLLKKFAVPSNQSVEFKKDIDQVYLIDNKLKNLFN